MGDVEQYSFRSDRVMTELARQDIVGAQCDVVDEGKKQGRETARRQ